MKRTIVALMGMFAMLAALVAPAFAQSKGTVYYMVPTLLDLMGKPMEDRFTGHSLVPLMKGGVAQETDVFIEWNPSKEEIPTEAIPGVDMNRAKRALESHTRTVVSPSGWKLCLNDQDSDQLFNLNLDPGETRNLYYTGMHNGRIEKLSRRIRRWEIELKIKN